MDRYELFRRVTSDCIPLPQGGRLGACRACGCVQKVTDRAWQLEVQSIYNEYEIYHQGEGLEQAVFDLDSGHAWPRSVRLLERLQCQVNLPTTGRLLDVGCGNGALLRAFSHFAPGWSLVGTELNDKYRSVVEEINGVEALYTCLPNRVPGSYDLVTLIHVLEHIPAPIDFVRGLSRKLGPGGHLVIEVPDYLQNPFDLLIADHCTHFTMNTLTELIKLAGFDVISAVTDWIPKELSVVARKAEHPGDNNTQLVSHDSFESAAGSLRWLETVVATAYEISRAGHFGLFGTSIAATWLFTELKGSVDFFVDEDPNRAGKTYLRHPVYHPIEIPYDSNVFIALPGKLAEAVHRRVGRSGVTYHIPPS